MAEPDPDVAPRTLLLVRHGQTAWNAEGRAQGHADVPLDEHGVSQAQLLGRHLAEPRGRHHLTGLWSSDLSRAAATAQEISATLRLPVTYDARLREFDVGERQGLTLAEFSRSHPDHPVGWAGYTGPHGVPGAETVEQVRARVVAALRDVSTALLPGETGVVVMHGAALRVGLFDLLGWPWEQVQTVAPVRNGHWAEVRIDQGGQTQLAAYNVTA